MTNLSNQKHIQIFLISVFFTIRIRIASLLNQKNPYDKTHNKKHWDVSQIEVSSTSLPTSLMLSVTLWMGIKADWVEINLDSLLSKE